MSNTRGAPKKNSAVVDGEKGRCPVPDSSSGGGSATIANQVSKHVNEIFARHVRRHHKPYYHISHEHEDEMSNVHRKLEAAGPKVEHAIVKGRELLEEGVNPELMHHALGVYLTHSKDAQERRIQAPALKEHPVFRAQRPETLQTPQPTAVAGEVVTGDTLQGPALLSYWRDDYDMNDAHYHWHMVFRGAGGNNSKNVRTIDRQGELFLYTHSQMVARYDTEGLCWGLPLVRPWDQYDDVLEYGYQPLPALLDYYGGYPAFSSWYRIRNPDMKDVPGVTIGVADMEEWRNNIYEAIKTGYVVTKPKNKPDTTIRRPLALTGDNCLNYVGGLLDAQYVFFDSLPDDFEIDAAKYGILHNYGLGKFSEMSYRDNDKEKVPYGLMISNFAAPRDPCFWPWYKHLQGFGQLAGTRYPQDITKHKAEVDLSNLVIRPQDTKSPLYANGGVTTFLGPPAADLLESKAKLDHEPFEWSVQVRSSREIPPSVDNPQKLTLRFFIAAKDLVNYYHHWIEMDKVTVTLTGESSILTVVRRDTESSVARKTRNYGEPDPAYASAWCRCGWPQNLMLPAGKPEGMPFVAFCMATDDALDLNTPTSALSFCGAILKDQKYPDPRGMGYPFNRAWTQLTNATTGKISISTIIGNNTDFPFITSSDFKIFRMTKYRHPAADPLPTGITWNNTIKDYFTQDDVDCMVSEYGYNLRQYEDVKYHCHNIYWAVASGRMPLQMDPYTQSNPDPKHPLWTVEMCDNFRAWMLVGCPEDTEDTDDMAGRKLLHAVPDGPIHPE
ncbi:hypothetical protein IFM62136_03734 [Aspergillus lentulus]|nr:hypothetical protein IFM62136_03734 [Aspergillus lentulus]